MIRTQSIRDVVETFPVWSTNGPICFIKNDDSLEIWVSKIGTEKGDESIITLGKFQFINDNGDIIAFFRREPLVLFPQFIDRKMIQKMFRNYMGDAGKVVDIAY